MTTTLGIDKESFEWRRIRQWIDENKDAATDQLIRPGLNPIQTEFQRGRVAALNDLLEAVTGDKIPVTPAEEDEGDYVTAGGVY
jgi:hypothetical protein